MSDQRIGNLEQTGPDIDTEKRPWSVLEKPNTVKKWLFGIAVAALFGVSGLVIHYDSIHEAKHSATLSKQRTKESTVVKDTLNGHEWVDLGLPSGTKWATCNIGATAPEGLGDYYAWGETEPKSDYIDINSLTHRKDVKWLMNNGILDREGELSRQHDVASLLWGEPWRMPTDDDFGELIDFCKWEFTTYNGANGYMVTGPNQQTIFIVAAGFQHGEAPEYIGEYGDYWSSTAVTELTGASCSLGYSPQSYGRRRYARFVGRTIRPVTD